MRRAGFQVNLPGWDDGQTGSQEAIMNEDVLNMSVRKFLKKVGVTSQREIEEAVRAALGDGRLKGNEALPAKVTLTVGGIDLSVEIEGAVELE